VTSTFTVVCVYNSEATLEKYLRPGLRRQVSPYELRLVDNRAHQFSNAADALNHGAKDASTDYLVFVHQDVELLTPDFFDVASVYLAQVPELGIAGIVGATSKGGSAHLRGRCLQGDAEASSFAPGYEVAQTVQTVDEMLLIVPRLWFEQLRFDSTTCPAWDLYGADYALTSARHGRQAVVLPLPVRHASWGKLRRSYFHSLVGVQRKHHDVRMVYTTCGTWPNGRGAWRHWATHKGKSARNLAFKRLKGLLSL
jgi:glycosyltransferase involved in cell wall biosynthesis